MPTGNDSKRKTGWRRGLADWLRNWSTSRHPTRLGRSARRSLQLERLEARELLSASPVLRTDRQTAVQVSPPEPAPQGVFNVPGLTPDQDGDVYTVQLIGPGTVSVVQHDPDADGKGPIAQISLHNTDQARSRLVVTATKALGGDGLVSIGSIAADAGVRSISAPASNLVGSGIKVTGLLGSLKVRDVMTGAVIEADGTAAQKTSVIAHVFQDGTTMDVGSSIATLQAAAVGDGVIKAAAIDVLRVLGDTSNEVNGVLTPIVGNFNADLTLSGTGNPLKPTTLGRATVTGGIASATWQVTGDCGPLTAQGSITSWTFSGPGSIRSLTLGGVDSATIEAATRINSVTAQGWKAGSLKAGSINVLRIAGNLAANVTLSGAGVPTGRPTLNVAAISGAVKGSYLAVTGIVNVFTAEAFVDSLLLAGFAQTDPYTLFTERSKINSFRVTGAVDAFANSWVGAWAVGVVSLASVRGKNNGESFGVVAEVSIQRVTVKDPPFLFTSTAALPPFDDFVVVVIQ